MLRSMPRARRTSSSMPRCPGTEKKASTMTSRCRVAFSRCEAMYAANFSLAAATVAEVRGPERFILILILNLDIKMVRPARRRINCKPRGREGPRNCPSKNKGFSRAALLQPAALLRQRAPGFRALAGIGPGEPQQRGMRPLPDARVGVVEPIDPLRGIARSAGA